MKNSFKVLRFLFLIAALLLSCNQNKDSQQNNLSRKNNKFPGLFGPYFGQEPPGRIPKIFAPEIISTALQEAKISFSKDGNELFFNTWVQGPFTKKFHFFTHIENNGYWTKPEKFKYLGKRDDFAG